MTLTGLWRWRWSGVVYSTAFTNYSASTYGSSGGGGDGGVGAPQGQGPSANNGNTGGNTNWFGYQIMVVVEVVDQEQVTTLKMVDVVEVCSSGGHYEEGVTNQNTYGSNNVVGIGYNGGQGYPDGSYPQEQWRWCCIKWWKYCSKQ